MEYIEVEGDLIFLSLQGKFDVIAHGCNCFCVQGAGIAKQMSNIFGTDNPIKYPLEMPFLKGDINKLGRISYREYYKFTNNEIIHPRVIVVNAYTQYKPGPNLDYEALTLCLRKMNHIFKGKYLGLPQIGAGIAGGDWEKIKTIIQQELKDCDVTVVIYNK